MGPRVLRLLDDANPVSPDREAKCRSGPGGPASHDANIPIKTVHIVGSPHKPHAKVRKGTLWHGFKVPSLLGEYVLRMFIANVTCFARTASAGLAILARVDW